MNLLTPTYNCCIADDQVATAVKVKPQRSAGPQKCNFLEARIAAILVWLGCDIIPELVQHVQRS